MTVSLFLRFQVRDFEAWVNPSGDEVAQMMQNNGVLAYSLHQNLNNPNWLMVHHQLADEKALESLLAWLDTIPDGNRYYQALPGTLEMWVGDDHPFHWRPRSA